MYRAYICMYTWTVHVHVYNHNLSSRNDVEFFISEKTTSLNWMISQNFSNVKLFHTSISLFSMVAVLADTKYTENVHMCFMCSYRWHAVCFSVLEGSSAGFKAEPQFAGRWRRQGSDIRSVYLANIRGRWASWYSHRWSPDWGKCAFVRKCAFTNRDRDQLWFNNCYWKVL